MGVAAQRKPEMAERIGGVARLHLGPKHLLHDLVPRRVVGADAVEDVVEHRLA